MQTVIRRSVNKFRNPKPSQDADEDLYRSEQLGFFIGKTTYAAFRICELPRSSRQWQLGGGLAIT